MAQLNRGALATPPTRDQPRRPWLPASSAATLARLLGAVASFAAGGRAALEKLGDDSAKLLLQQLQT